MTREQAAAFALALTAACREHGTRMGCGSEYRMVIWPVRWGDGWALVTSADGQEWSVADYDSQEWLR